MQPVTGSWRKLGGRNAREEIYRGEIVGGMSWNMSGGDYPRGNVRENVRTSMRDYRCPCAVPLWLTHRHTDCFRML